MRIYLAGPLFTTAERAFNKRLAEVLEQFYRHEVWLPQEKEPRDKSAMAIFREDVKGIDWAEAVVANMDGPDPDSGTCWECGYAFGRGKLVVNFRTDIRNGDDGSLAPYNLMMWAAADEVYVKPLASIEKIATRIHEMLEFHK